MLSSSNVKISVIIACYNAEKYLAEAMDSVLNQTFSNFEVIAVDDASTDGTTDILKSYASQDMRIRVHSRKENGGPAVARNLGVSLAQGEWIAVLDSDDVALPTRLEEQLAFVEIYPQTVLLGSACFEVDSKGTVLKEHIYPTHHSSLVLRLERNKAFPPHSSCLYHAGTFRQIGGFNSRFKQSEDWDLWLRLGEGGTLASLPRSLVKIRRHTDNISYDNDGRTQIVMGISASMCHFLRTRYSVDPSISSAQLWDQFLTWVHGRLEQEEVFAVRREWARLREVFHSATLSRRLCRLWELARGFSTSEKRCGILKYKLFGSGLASRLADEWIESGQTFSHEDRSVTIHNDDT